MRKVLTVCLVCLTGLLLSAVVYAQFGQQIRRAPDVLPGTIPEMRDPEFWIARMDNPDEVILTPSAIQQMNADFQKKMSSPDPFSGVAEERMLRLRYWWQGYEVVMPDFSALTPEVIADTVRVKIQGGIEQVTRGRGTPSNFQGIPYAEWEIEEFVDRAAVDQVGNNIEIKYGISVVPTLMRQIPTFPPKEIGLRGTGIQTGESFNICILHIATPVTVFHRSRRGDYLFVASDEAYGWVRAVDIAISTRERIAQFANPENFVVCTGDRELFYTNESCEYAAGHFMMGNRLPLTEDNNTRKISVPVKTSYGDLIAGSVWLAEDANVSVGWLPHTRRNIVKTAFELLDTPYDWQGGRFGRNHETNMRDIFACFGFDLPFHGNLFTHYSDTERVAIPPEGTERPRGNYASGGRVDEKLAQAMFKQIMQNEPYVTIMNAGGSGHTLLLLDEYEGDVYAFDLHGYGYLDEEGNQIEIKRTVVENMAMGVPVYALTNPIIFCELK